jgi:DeoR/GlpR family transcriptional regulator of sugar metabolism
MKQTDERKKSILEKLEREGKVYVSDLSLDYNISEVTIRKDLQELEDQGSLHRVHGGAILVQPEKTAVESTLDQLAALHKAEKQMIAKAAVPYVEDGDSLLFDTSTSAREVARLLMKEPFKNLTIITTSLQLSQELAVCRNIQVIQIGGLVRSTLYTTMGPIATETLRELHVDKSFIGVNGIDPKVGLTTQNLLECEVKRNIINASTQSFVLADYSKMYCITMSVIVPVTGVDHIITDKNSPAEIIHQLREKGVDVIVAE